MIGKIYLIKNKINGKRYVGQTIQKISWRWKQHLRDSKKLDYPLYKAIRKYGIENFDVSELDSTENLAELDDLERKHVKLQKSFIDWKQGGYNLTEGGWGHHNVSIETKAKLSKLHKGVPKTAEHNRKVGLANMGKPNANTNRTIITLINKITNVSFTGLRKDFYHKFSLDSRRVGELLQGKRKSHKGWVVSSLSNSHPNDKIICQLT